MCYAVKNMKRLTILPIMDFLSIFQSQGQRQTDSAIYNVTSYSWGTETTFIYVAHKRSLTGLLICMVSGIFTCYLLVVEKHHKHQLFSCSCLPGSHPMFS